MFHRRKLKLQRKDLQCSVVTKNKQSFGGSTKCEYIARTPNLEQIQGLWILMREKERIPSNDNCDYTLVINYLLIIIPNHSDCTFGTIFFLYKRWHEGHETGEGSVRERFCTHSLASSHKDLPFARPSPLFFFLIIMSILTCYII